MESPKTESKTADQEYTLPQKTISFIVYLTGTFPEIRFKNGRRFSYHAPNIVTLGPAEPGYTLLTLHEVGHALCHHQDYKLDVERLKIESEAWQRAKKLCAEHPEWKKRFGISYDEDFAEAQLDSYRDWLHQKSLCKKCHLTRFQDQNGKYICPNCDMLG